MSKVGGATFFRGMTWSNRELCPASDLLFPGQNVDTICLVIKALIFDLDSCLAAADEAGEDLFEPAFQAIRSANQGEVSDEQLRAAFKDCWRFPFDFIADKYGFSEAMRAAGFAAFKKIEVRKTLHGYGDLSQLGQLPAKLFLVTSGFRLLQESKVNALGMAHLFTAVHIDAIDEGNGIGKFPVFAKILQEHGFRPDEVLVVGDNPDSEIAAGNQLGMVTIQTLRPGVPPSPAATHHIRTLTELKRFL
ncbi:MAG: HAD family hydrolase [Verrucomicrobiota bacterium]|jgi:putative hydrolase of the HAD superfamily